MYKHFTSTIPMKRPKVKIEKNAFWRYYVSQKRRHIRLGIEQHLSQAPAAIKTSILALFPAAKAALDAGYQPDARGVPIKSWRCLLELLADIAGMRHSAEMLLRVTSDLLAIADKMAPAGEALRQSAEILVHALHADMYVCRLRSPDGAWQIHTAARPDGGDLPLLSPILEEGLKNHPVMQAIISGGARHVVSNNLQGLERGGEALDCSSYRAGYRSRLAFVLRERMDGRPPFGLVLLYTRREYGFDMYDDRFLTKCARIVSLTVGRRVSVTRDTLEKAAGAIAHHGNNALNILRNQAEYCGELAEDMNSNINRALELVRRLAEELPLGSSDRELAEKIENILNKITPAEMSAHLNGVLENSRRMARIIKALKLSADRPRLMHYALGRDVLDLGDTSKD
jgi:hypothetical protein